MATTTVHPEGGFTRGGGNPGGTAVPRTNRRRPPIDTEVDSQPRNPAPDPAAPRMVDPGTLQGVHRPGGMPDTYCNAKPMVIPSAFDAVYGAGAGQEIMDGIGAVAESRADAEAGATPAPQGEPTYTPPDAQPAPQPQPQPETTPEGGGAPQAVPREGAGQYVPPNVPILPAQGGDQGGGGGFYQPPMP